MSDPLGEHRDLFELPEELAYLNTSNMSPLLRSVREAGERGLERRASPWTIKPADWFSDVERLRERFATLIGAEADGIALIPATSYGVAVAASNLRAEPGQRILVLHEEYPSSYYGWTRFADLTGAELTVVDREPGEGWTDAVLAAIDERVAVVAAVNVHWTNGAFVDLARVGARAREVGAAFVIDASQSCGAMPLDVAALRPDFLVTVGYKWMLGPFGVGFMYVAPAHRDGEPIEENWILRAGSEDFAGLVDYEERYLPGARRFDVGARTNFGLVPMAIAAIDQLLVWGVEGIAAGLRGRTSLIAERAGGLGLDVPPDDARGPHMLGIEFPQDAVPRVIESLGEAGVVAGFRGSSLRISPHLHTTTADVDRLTGALERAL